MGGVAGGGSPWFWAATDGGGEAMWAMVAGEDRRGGEGSGRGVVATTGGLVAGPGDRAGVLSGELVGRNARLWYNNDGIDQ